MNFPLLNVLSLEELWKVSGVLGSSRALQRLREPCVLPETFSREAGSEKETVKGEKSVQGMRRQGSWANKYLVMLAGELGWTGSKLMLVDIC